MQLNDTQAIRRLFAERKGWLTVEEISVGLGMSNNTISRALSGETLRPKTIKQLAAALEESPMSIAHYVE